jgi:hypothetical protein
MERNHTSAATPAESVASLVALAKAPHELSRVDGKAPHELSRACEKRRPGSTAQRGQTTPLTASRVRPPTFPAAR